jgi:putative restriction endonuclease
MSDTAVALPETELERRYALRDVKHRLHQLSFREAVIAAYNGRRALSPGCPSHYCSMPRTSWPTEMRSTDSPSCRRDVPLSKIHHAAFDAHLIGIDPDYRVHVSDRLLSLNDGPMLEALKRLHNGKLYLPARPRDCPDPDRFALRYDAFKAAA